ncbi:TetR/AcrR family transcriptional regulator [Mycobacteroides abscessus]|uniref:TetR/AcrR family transcriptional regulator n=1 Tax=Mycobacteroides abscessus TaxID=36809 RepID=UPI0009A8695C|nr:TetR/AcrR family transcriptional regulator [Mycobacteroides abscessus]SKI74440.1 putative transcriptional regulator, TetR family [Mycobacteroides abscessus subsp. massiliense]SKM55635.1 putative transcriptional regulator, TetR family [Mycobacteroides abscessus subsp. massiliense]SKP98669.1 putative transcriptional regulator, TetR family [Mycobacteroides abscessus subsp. massiliense]SKQ07147.1 putative transcriptional regulator, TetR family [Mycobacteroides abscessus subsp. massiliense]SLL01
MTTTEPTAAARPPGDAPYLSMRRPQVLDAAVRMLAVGGDRALTYRNVDQAADVPPGTTSNHFRTRVALLLGAATHIERQRRRTFEELLEQYEPTTTGQLAKMLKAYLADTANDTGRTGKLARAHTALLPLALNNPELAELLATGHQLHTAALHRRLTAINPAASPGLAALITDYLAGTLATLHATGTTDTRALPALAELLDHGTPGARTPR